MSPEPSETKRAIWGREWVSRSMREPGEELSASEPKSVVSVTSIVRLLLCVTSAPRGFEVKKILERKDSTT